MQELQEVLQGIIQKYNVEEADVAAINEALLNLESPEYEGADEGGEGDDFEDPYAEDGE